MCIDWNFPYLGSGNDFQNIRTPYTIGDWGNFYNPIQDTEGSDENAPSYPSGVAPSVDNCVSTDVVCVGPCVVHNEGPPSLPAIGPNLKDWIPSRGRDLPPVLYMDASGTQPSGDSLPSLLPSPNPHYGGSREFRDNT